MKNNIYNKNWLIFFEEKEINFRNRCEEEIKEVVYSSLKKQNRSFEIIKIEAPQLTPSELISSEYSENDYYNLWDISLRPETTMGTFEYAQDLLKGGYSDIKYRVPIIIYQHWKSFRREQDQPTKFMRLKEFHQLEFQCLFYPDTANDYTIELFQNVSDIIEKLIGKKCRLEQSDRIPHYSEDTIDVICEENNMEVCSMSIRKDWPIVNWVKMKVIEIAVWTDRLIYNRF